MKFLIDTNIVLPLEPATPADIASNTTLANEFYRLAANSKTSIYVHPAIQHDFGRDRDENRAKVRRAAIAKFNELRPAPPSSLLSGLLLGTPPYGTNDWVDNQLIDAVASDIVDYLVTDDTGIHKKANRSGLSQRVLSLGDAVSVLRDLFDKNPPPLPSVEQAVAYQIEPTDPILDSLRADYSPRFDKWFATCRNDHRTTFLVRHLGSKRIAALCILKPEEELPDGRPMKVLKLCTFKVADEAGGNRYGELLLKAVLDYVDQNQYDCTYFSVFPKLTQLIDFAQDFGFQESGRTSIGELVMIKEVRANPADIKALSAFDLHIKYGPRVTSFQGNQTYVVPIKPQYHAILFPECEKQLTLSINGRPCGNSIKKAYLCNSQSKSLQTGDNVLFYRSADAQSATVLGIVENTFRSQSPDEIARHVGKRTVYSYDNIQSMCQKEVLAINFRLVRILAKPLQLTELQVGEVLTKAPQSITQVRAKGIEWLRNQIAM